MRKKIAHVTFNLRAGGAEKVIFSLIEHADNSKYDLSIICLEQPIGIFGVQMKERGISVISFNWKPGFNISLIRQIRQYVKQQNIDILHCHQYTPYIYGFFASMFNKSKVVFTEHSRFYPYKKELKRIILHPLLLLFTDYFTTISHANREALIKYENLPPKKIDVIYNGINYHKFNSSKNSRLKKSLGIDSETFVVGTIAGLDPIRNYILMIQALHIVRKRFPKTCLLFVGDDAEMDWLKAQISALGLSSNVFIVGFKYEPYNYYTVMDIFISTAFSESSSVTLLEAMAAGKPCIVSEDGGNPEVIQDNINGFVIPIEQKQTFADRIIFLQENRDLRLTMGQESRKRYESEFVVDKMVQSYQNIYESL